MVREEVKIWIRIRGNYHGSGSSKIIRFLWIRICNTWLNLNTFFIQDACNIMHTLRCVQYVGVCDILTWKINLNGPPTTPPAYAPAGSQTGLFLSEWQSTLTNTHQHSHTHPIKILSCPVEWKNFSPNHSTQLASLQFSSPGTDHNLFDLFDYFYLLIYLFCPLVLILFLLSLSFYLFEFEEKNLRSYFRPFALFPGLTFIHRLKFLFYYFIFLFF